MITARVANGRAVAAAAEAEVSGRATAVITARRMPAAHMIMRREDREMA
jgi:hypothetical protein